MSSVRVEESQQLIRILDRLRDGRGGVVEVLGDPGSGKSRILAQLAADARRRSFTVLDGRCYPSEQNDPLHVFTLALGPLLRPEYLTQLSPRHADILRAGLCARLKAQHGAASLPTPLSMSQAIHALLAVAAGNGLVVVLDDFHWADPQSLELADHLARWHIDAPVLIVIAHRPRQAAPRLRSTLAQGAEMERVARVELGPLDLQQTARMVSATPDTTWLPTVHHDSQGIPLYVLVLGESAPLSPSIGAELLTGRLAPLAAELATLSAEQRLVADSGAVLGDRFSQEDLATVSELPFGQLCAAVTALIRLDILRAVGHSAHLTFRHPVLRRLLHDRANTCWRARAHRRALTVLNRRAASAAERAVHIELSAGNFVQEDLETLARAGTEAALSSPVDAARWLLLALRGLPLAEPTNQQRLSLIPPLAQALRAANYLSGQDELQQLLLKDSALGPADAHHTVIRFCALVESLQGRYAAADELLAGEMAALADGGADQEAPAHLMLTRAIVGLLRQDPLVPDLAAAALRLAYSSGRPLVIAGALAVHALGELTAGRDAACIVSYETALWRMAELPDDSLSGNTEYLCVLGWCANALGRVDEAEHLFERGLALAQDITHSVALPALLSGLAEVQLRQAQLESARSTAAEAAAVSDSLGARHSYALARALEALSLTYAEPSGNTRASALAEEAFRSLRPEHSHWHSAGVLTLAEAMLLQGRPERCLTLLLDLDGPDVGSIELPWRTQAYELLALASPASGAGEGPWAARAESRGRMSVLPHLRAYALLTHGHALSRGTAPSAAVAVYQEAGEIFESSQLRLGGLTAKFRAARAAYAGDRLGEATQLWSSTRKLAEQWGVRLYAELSPDGSLEHTTARGCHSVIPAQRVEPLPGLGQLTQREQEVAQLASAGRRTREIAEALGMSPRTVDVHLSRIYRKLQIGSRLDLVRLMAQGGFKVPERR